MGTQIRLLLEQSDQGPHCLPVCKNKFEKFARIFSRRHKQTTFSDAGFLGVLRVKGSKLRKITKCDLKKKKKKKKLRLKRWKTDSWLSQLAFFVNLHRAVIGPSATLTGRWRPDIDLRRMLTGIPPTCGQYKQYSYMWMHLIQLIRTSNTQVPDRYRNTVDSRYLELHGTLWNISRYPYLDISDLQNWGK